MEIVEGIHQVEGVNGNVYLVVNEGKLILIDTGMPRSSDKILKYIHKMGRTPSDVSQIVLTHSHIDHVGSAYKLKKATNAKIAVHEEDADFVAGKKPAPKPKNILLSALSSVFKPTPVEPDVRLKENDRAGNLIVVHTPGHTIGSISLLDPARKVLFVGDAITFRNGKLAGPTGQFTQDAIKAKQSIQKISMLDFDVMLSGHGDPLRPEAANKVKTFYAAMK
jgi:glyoxylase-like metal-dependent hydrolase (beta-lactamase superfamily II)